MARHIWTTPQIEALKEVYPDYPSDAIAKAIGCSVSTVHRKANSLGLLKSEAFNASSMARRLDGLIGKDTRFQKGLTPWNKGMKGLCYEGSVPTQFKPGERRGVAVKLYQPIGTERISKDGYIERKINDGMPLQKRWRAVHLINWEAANGPLPPGHAVVFKDRNKQNTDISNLELITRRELMQRNTIHNLPPELKQVVNLKRVITRIINGKEKQNESADQHD